jgi:uncharacterized protein (UPF0332 family)
VSPEQRDLVDTAKDSIEAASLLLVGGFPGYAAARAYYAMFYLAEAFLEGEGLSFSKHSAVISAFGKHFAVTGRVPAEFHGHLIKAFEIRQAGDYGNRQAVGVEEAQEQISRARGFLELAEKTL